MNEKSLLWRPFAILLLNTFHKFRQPFSKLRKPNIEICCFVHLLSFSITQLENCSTVYYQTTVLLPSTSLLWFEVLHKLQLVTYMYGNETVPPVCKMFSFGNLCASGAAPADFKCSSQKVGVVRNVVILWTSNCYRYSVSILILATCIYTNVLTVVHIQIKNQLLPKAQDRRWPLLTNLHELTYERSPLLTIDALIITILRSTPLLKINVHLYLQKLKHGTWLLFPTPTN